jgi:hypothetical protein
MSEPTKEEVLAMCESIRKCDDSIGHASDHEGDENGPTWHMWRLGQKRFARHVAAMVEWHRRAAYRWEKAGKLNNRRKKPNA